jgi:2-methylcitrate dehydratase PrpD
MSFAANQHRSSSVPTDPLLKWATNLTFDDLPEAAVERLRDDVIDGLGCGLFGSGLWASRVIRTALAEQSGGVSGQCLVWGTEMRLSALDAVAVNAAAVNGFELDPGHHLVRNVHGAVTVYPVLVAVSQLTRSLSGADFLAAAAAGIETSVRVSKAVGPSLMDRGWYGTPIYATLGSTVAAGRALGLDLEQMKGAFELALLRASGLTVTSEEGMGKPLSSSEAVRTGLLCALLAAKGGRGPRHAYDHPKGFIASFGKPDERDDSAFIVEPGQSLACEHISAKQYASCGAGHPVADIIGDFMQSNPTVGPETVESVQVRLNPTTARHIGGSYEPGDVTNAQFNLAYCVATQLLEGDNSIEQFRPELLGDERVLNLTRRVQVIPDEASSRMETYVTVRLRNGKILEGHAEDKRDPDRDGIRRKFSSLVSGVITDEAASQMIKFVDGLEDVDDVSRLVVL